MRLGAGYAKKKEEEEEERRTANNPQYLSTYWSFNRFLKTDIKEDNFTLSSMGKATNGKSMTAF